MAKKVPHLVTKKGRFYFRMRVPDALADQFGNEVSRALGDVTKAQAEVECRRLGHEYADRFLVARHRLGLAAQPPVPAPAPQRVATPTEVRDLGRASARRMLALDEEARIEGAESELWDWWRSELSDLDRAITRALSEGDMRDLWHDFRKELTKNGLALPDERSERRRLVHSWALEHGRALRDIDARERGHPVDTPPPVVPTKAYRMRDAFDAWKAAAVRPPKTIEAFGRHVATFETMMGDPVLSSLRRADAIRFRDALQSWAVDKKRTARTADNVLATVKALANVAIDREWLGQDRRNPFERLAVLKAVDARRAGDSL